MFETQVRLSPRNRYFYIGKTVNFRERLRKHFIGFLRPDSARPQPYMNFLISLAGGCPAAALSGLIFVPIALCINADSALELEQHIINSEHPPLNEPYVSSLLAGSFAKSWRCHRRAPTYISL